MASGNYFRILSIISYRIPPGSPSGIPPKLLPGGLQELFTRFFWESSESFFRNSFIKSSWIFFLRNSIQGFSRNSFLNSFRSSSNAYRSLWNSSVTPSSNTPNCSWDRNSSGAHYRIPSPWRFFFCNFSGVS